MKKRIKNQLIKAAKKSSKYLQDKPRLKHIAKKTILTTEKIIGFNIIPTENDYAIWLKKHELTEQDIASQTKLAKALKNKPLISIVTPTYNTQHDYLKECIQSVINQTYTNWELILVDDCSTDEKVRDILKDYEKQDKRIKVVLNDKNMHIADATNRGIAIANGEYIGFLDHDDVLYSNALYENALAINNHNPDFIYSDEDKLSENGKQRLDPFFKPDWSPDFLRSINYITHFTIIKKDLIKKVGGLRKKYDGAQDWDLFLRATSAAKNIYHIQKVLYGWRMSATSTAKDVNSKPYVVEAQKNALLDDAKDRGFNNVLLAQSKLTKDYWDLNYTPKGNPLVSIVIPTKNQYVVAKRCIDSILDKSTYSNYEIILVDTGSDDPQVASWYKQLANTKDITIVNWPEQPFSYARACNEGAKQARGYYLIMLNNDTEVITNNWIELMLGDAQRPDVGSVGARLYYPKNIQIQHAGIGIGLGGYAANLLSEMPEDRFNSIQKVYANNKRNVACCTAACLMLPKKVFFDVDGFDEEFRITYNDVDLGLKLLDKGYLNIYNPIIALTHHESISLGKPDEKKRDSAEFVEAKNMLAVRWQKFIKADPYYNENFDKNSANFTYNK